MAGAACAHRTAGSDHIAGFLPFLKHATRSNTNERIAAHVGQLFDPDRHRRTTHAGSAYCHEYTFVFTRVHGITPALGHKMGCVKLVGYLFRALLVTGAEDIT